MRVSPKLGVVRYSHAEARTLTAPDWKTLTGGYRTPYDPRGAVLRLRTNPLDSDAWHELWNELYHQGNVGDASYAAVPLLVQACGAGLRDWNFFSLVSTVEVARHRKVNPELPTWLRSEYEASLNRAADLALNDLQSASELLVIRSALSVVALARGDLRMGTLLSVLDGSDIDEQLEARVGWSTAFREPSG